LFTFSHFDAFQQNVIRGLPNDWHCRAGGRFLYICEDGLVHYCSQQRGRPGIPLADYTREDVVREAARPKGCAPFCTISCVHQVSMVDQFRDEPKEFLQRLFSAKSGDHKRYAQPAIVRILEWVFLPPRESTTRRKIAQGFTRAALSCLKVR